MDKHWRLCVFLALHRLHTTSQGGLQSRQVINNWLFVPFLPHLFLPPHLSYDSIHRQIPRRRLHYSPYLLFLSLIRLLSAHCTLDYSNLLYRRRPLPLALFLKTTLFSFLFFFFFLSSDAIFVNLFSSLSGFAPTRSWWTPSVPFLQKLLHFLSSHSGSLCVCTVCV